jgi:hypothetical protein
MKVFHRKCVNSYNHYYRPFSVVWDEPDSQGSRMREILLICQRCEHHYWIDSVVRSWLGIPSSDDWGA